LSSKSMLSLPQKIGLVAISTSPQALQAEAII
jgi:hypothetical protein